MEKLKNKRYLIAIFLMTVTLIVTAATYVDTVMSDKRIETALKEYGTQIGAHIMTFEEITETGTGTYYSYPYDRHDTLESMKNDIDTLRTKEENIHIHIYPVDSVIVELTSINLYLLIMLLCILKIVHTGFAYLTSRTSCESELVKRGERIYDEYINNRYSVNIPCTVARKYKRDKIKYMISMFFILTFSVVGAAMLLFSYIRENSTERYTYMVINSLGFILIVMALFIIKNNISNNIYCSRKILFSRMSNIDLRCMYCYLNEKYVNMNCDAAPVSIIKIGSALVILSLIISFNTLLVVQLIFLL